MVDNKDKFPDETRLQILEAAQKRFSQYGYSKTTMAEIAKDCSMSAANIYRYFDNKLDIGANLSCRCLEDHVEKCKLKVDGSQLSAGQRLEELLLTLLRLVHQQWAENPHMDEMVNAICQERREIVNQHIEKKQQLITQILQEGNQLEEFDIKDPERTAAAVFTTFTLFVVPLMMPLFPLSELEVKAKEVIQLLLTGLNKR